MAMPLDPAKIKKLREKKGLTQAQAAASAGMARSGWARVETGAHPNPTLQTAQRVAAALGASLDSIVR
jgi:transcriptional regulator with XRE-family HTH domain